MYSRSQTIALQQTEWKSLLNLSPMSVWRLGTWYKVGHVVVVCGALMTVIWCYDSVWIGGGVGTICVYISLALQIFTYLNCMWAELSPGRFFFCLFVFQNETLPLHAWNTKNPCLLENISYFFSFTNYIPEPLQYINLSYFITVHKFITGLSQLLCGNFCEAVYLHIYIYFFVFGFVTFVTSDNFTDHTVRICCKILLHCY